VHVRHSVSCQSSGWVNVSKGLIPPRRAIRPVDRSCGSYGLGHQVHWKQAKKSAEEWPVIHVSMVVHDDGRIDLEGHELKLTMLNHDPDRLRDAVEYRGRGRAVWKPRFHVLAMPGPSGYLFSLAALDNRTPCHPGARQAPGEPTPDFLAGNEGRSRLHGAWAEPPRSRGGGGPGISKGPRLYALKTCDGTRLQDRRVEGSSTGRLR
jgi:hypothetical protein